MLQRFAYDPSEHNRPPIWHNTEIKSEANGSIILIPQVDNTSPRLSEQERFRHNGVHLDNRSEGSTVVLTARLSPFTTTGLEVLGMLMKYVRTKDGNLVMLESALGCVRVVREDWIELEIDVLLWHELQVDDCLLFQSGPFVAGSFSEANDFE